MIPTLEDFVSAWVLEVDKCETFLISDKSERHLFNVELWDQTHSQRSVTATWVFDSLDHSFLLSINQIHIQVHIYASCHEVTLVLDGCFDILLSEIYFVTEGQSVVT